MRGAIAMAKKTTEVQEKTVTIETPETRVRCRAEADCDVLVEATTIKQDSGRFMAAKALAGARQIH